jgi:hypothetical protein
MVETAMPKWSEEVRQLLAQRIRYVITAEIQWSLGRSSRSHKLAESIIEEVLDALGMSEPKLTKTTLPPYLPDTALEIEMDEKKILRLCASLLDDYGDHVCESLSAWKWPEDWTAEDRAEFIRMADAYIGEGPQCEVDIASTYGPRTWLVAYVCAEWLGRKGV